MNRPKILTLLALFAALSFCAPSTWALPGDLSSKFPVNDDNPSANIPSEDDALKDPLEFGYFLQDLIARAEGAFLKKDWANSVKYYEALGKAVPDRAISFSRLCAAYAELGKVDQAVASCRRAIGRGGAQVMDHFRFITLSLQKKQLSTRDIADIDASLAHLREFAATKSTSADTAASASAASLASAASSASSDALPATTPPVPPSSGAPSAPSAARPPLSAFAAAHDAATAELQRRKRAQSETAPAAEQRPATASLPLEIEVVACKLAVYLKDAKRLAACVQALQSIHADEKMIVPFEWSAALVAKDRPKASAILERAEALHYPEAALAAMRAEQQRMFKSSLIPDALKRGGSWLFGLLLVVLAAAAALWWTMTNQRRRKVEPENPA